MGKTSLFRGYGTFVAEFFRRSHTTGAVLPSGPSLCRALAMYIDAVPGERGVPVRETPEAVATRTGRRVLEVGPGTGCVTREIARRLGPSDTLELVECNPTFVAALHRMLETDPILRAVADRVRIRECYLQEHESDGQYDRIVSGLPLNNFSAELVADILAQFRRLARPDGTVSWFEYIAIRRVKSVVSFGADRARLHGITASLNKILHPHEFRRQAILANVPPAWVHHVRFDELPDLA